MTRFISSKKQKTKRIITKKIFLLCDGITDDFYGSVTFKFVHPRWNWNTNIKKRVEHGVALKKGIFSCFNEGLIKARVAR